MLKNWKGDVRLSGIQCRSYIEFHCQTMIAVWEQSQRPFLDIGGESWPTREEKKVRKLENEPEEAKSCIG